MSDRIVAGDWFAIGLYRGPSPTELRPASHITNPILTYRDVTDGAALFVADPFLIRHDGRWYLFFEVLDDRTYKGEIAVAVSEDGHAWRYEGRVLVADCNLSYPHVFAWNDDIYMVPETHQRNRVDLYRAVSFPHAWQVVTTLLHDTPAVDASPFSFDDRWWMFTCNRPEHHDELRLYHAEELEGPWREHPNSPLRTDDPRASRPAGRVVIADGRPIRFAQNCRPHYGAAVCAFEVTTLDREQYRERPIVGSPLRELQPWNRVAHHHVDAHRLDDGSWLAVVDGYWHRH
ncbi:MAG: hypothetical protein AAGD38_01810 [Acidobacteriota bacterium]